MVLTPDNNFIASFPCRFSGFCEMREVRVSWVCIGLTDEGGWAATFGDNGGRLNAVSALRVFGKGTEGVVGEVGPKRSKRGGPVSR